MSGPPCDEASWTDKAEPDRCNLELEQVIADESIRPLGALERVLDSACDAILIIEESGRVLWGNRAASSTFAPEGGQTCIGMQFDELWADPSPAQLRRGLEAAGREAPWSFRGRAAGSDPSHVTWEGHVTSAKESEASGTRLLVILRDVTAHLEREAQLAWSANFDALTELPNRATFRRSLDAALARGAPLTLVLLDADHLKLANDTDGHSAGDALLRSLAARLGEVRHPGALAARLGGDEFALMIESHLDDGSLGAILTPLCQPIQPEGFTLPVSASAGVAFSSTGNASASDLMQQADLALYEAKAKGRATWQVFDHRTRRRQQTRIAAIALLRRALEQGSVVPHYQPKVHLTTGRVVGYEALLRIQRLDGTLHKAAIIGEALGEADLAAEVDRVILRRVLSDLRHWQDLGTAAPVAVNLTSTTIRRPGFARDLLGSMAEQPIDTTLLEVEIIESVLLDGSADAVQENLATLSQAGVRIALDDFGTGFASLSHLKMYPVDLIKIDRQFVQSIVASPDDRAIVSAMVGLGESLSMQVVAEGIETEVQERILIAAGCEFGQGYLFSEAVPAEAVPGLLGLPLGPFVRSRRADRGAAAGS